MKRDMELVRKVLLATEENPDPIFRLTNLNIDGYTQVEISYHVKMLSDAGFVTAQNLTTQNDGLCWMPKSLTWEGHEFLDTIKNDTVWRKTTEFVIETGGAISVETLTAVATGLAKAHFGIG